MKFLVLFLFTVSFLFGVVDINNASPKELKTLKGIGKVKASAIVEFRKEHCFKSINELSLVKGVGAKTISKNRDNISVGNCR